MNLASKPSALERATRSDAQRLGRPLTGWRLKLYTVIFEADTPAGRTFDLLLISLILASVTVVMLDSVAGYRQRWGPVFDALEWAFTVLFTLEYIARLSCVMRPLRYARSIFGIIDLLAILPTYLSLLVPGLHALIDVRVLRLLRLFRVLKLGAYVEEYGMLGRALLASRRKILVFLSFVLLVMVVMGTLMYVVEGPANGFHSIPVSVYWAITTMTTVGFGDITPKTELGRFIASAMMLLGWGTLAVPTGIVSAEFTALRVRREPTTRTCPACLSVGHEPSARFCRDCGARLPRYFTDTEA
ncbi:ion transporter [Azohydromonas caseinilytica]|uniref:Ion transporter n=1 Tax=Azohydromonas caseinilytica TaxID=2728836 RepID=A0A848F5Z1_9BURK|nr:ion transporter [Azohydromonas caseinilytica]NML14076.1 ion transporter [Azohydromonas caseinilytica]